MPAGTLTLTNNSTIVKGTGTAFNTELKAGDFIVSTVGGVTYTLPVKTIDNATQVTLVKAYDGPTQAGAAWYAVPRDAMNAITAQLAAETAKALRGLNLDKENWQQVFSGNGNITVKLPDGGTYSGPAWNSFTAALNLKAEKKTVEDLASEVSKKASQSDVDTLAATVVKKADADKVINKGDYGLAVDNDSRIQTEFADIGSFRANAVKYGLCSMRNNKSMGGTAAWGLNMYSPIIWVKTGDTYGLINIPYNTSDPIIIAGGSKDSINTFRTLLDNTNTTTDANGFVKKASPIARISDNPDKMAPNYLDGFELSGLAAVNQEATGVSAKKIETGLYLISGALGLAKEGWDFEIPQDSNGNRLCFVTIQVNGNGEIMVRVSKRKMDFETATVIAGEPMDIPAGRWIDFRLEMPINDMEKNK